MTWPLAFLLAVVFAAAAALTGWLAYLRLERAQRVSGRLDALEGRVQQIWNALAIRQNLSAQGHEQKVK